MFKFLRNVVFTIIRVTIKFHLNSRFRILLIINEKVAVCIIVQCIIFTRQKRTMKLASSVTQFPKHFH